MCNYCSTTAMCGLSRQLQISTTFPVEMYQTSNCISGSRQTSGHFSLSSSGSGESRNGTMKLDNFTYLLLHWLLFFNRKCCVQQSECPGLPSTVPKLLSIHSDGVVNCQCVLRSLCQYLILDKFQFRTDSRFNYPATIQYIPNFLDIFQQNSHRFLRCFNLLILFMRWTLLSFSWQFDWVSVWKLPQTQPYIILPRRFLISIRDLRQKKLVQFFWFLPW